MLWFIKIIGIIVLHTDIMLTISMANFGCMVFGKYCTGVKLVSIA